MNYQYQQDLLQEVQTPQGGITSRPLFSDDATRVILFAFDTGQELSEHTASMPAILHILKGDATLTLGPDTKEASAGSWVYMEAHLPHSIVAKTPVVMLLTMIKAAKAAS